MEIKNYYKLLGIEYTSNLIEIKKAFRKEIALYHPDINTSKAAEKHFDDLVEAFDILSKPDKRKKYDTFLNNDISTPLQEDTNKEETLKAWKKEAKEKAEKIKQKNQENTHSVDIFSDVLIEGLLEVTSNIIEGTVDIIGDILG